jgi:hypothetical protein
MLARVGVNENGHWYLFSLSAAPKPKLSGQVRQHGLTGRLGFGERLEGRAAHPDRRLVNMDRAPRSYKAGLAVKSRPISTFVTDYERKAAFARAPYL